MGVGRTGMLALYWKNEARQESFWQQEPIHGKATRQKPLFKDDKMGLLLDQEASDYARKMLDPKLALAIAVRHKFFNQAISHSIKHSNHTKQVLLLGSGFDTRPLRKQKYSKEYGVKFFEVDKKEVLEHKMQLFKRHNLQPNSVMVAIDYLKDNLIEHLKSSGLDLTLPTHIIWEGNIFYLTQQQVETVLTQIKQAFTGELLISFDYLNSKLANVPEVDALKKKLGEDNTDFKCDIKNFMHELSARLGFKVVQHKSCSQLTQEYGVGETPYESQKNYYLCTLGS